MKNHTMSARQKLLSCVLIAALTCKAMSAVAYGAGKEGTPDSNSTQDPVSAVEQIFDQAARDAARQNISALSAADDSTKELPGASDETVYVITEPDGSAQKIIAAGWFKEEEGAQAYQMTDTMEELPVTIKISYWLDGREVTPEEVKGASGQLTIRFDFTNHTLHNVEVGGRQEAFHVPFLVLTGMILDSDKVSHPQITNGRLLHDGDRIIAAGIALPGLSDHFPMNPAKDDGDASLFKGERDWPEFIELRADVTDFDPGISYTLVTNEPFGKIRSDEFFDLQSLHDNMDDMKDAMVQLIDGANGLYEGTGDLLEGTSEKRDGGGRRCGGSAQVADGAARLQTGASDLHKGTGDLLTGADSLCFGTGNLVSGAGDLYAGADELVNGLSQLTANSDAINGGASQVFESLLSMAGSQLAAAGFPVEALTPENYEIILNDILSALNSDDVYNQACAMVQAQVEATVRAQNGTATEQEIQALIAQIMQSDDVISQINAAAEAARAGADQIAALKNSLDSYRIFYQGLLSYTSGVSQASDGATRLRDGAGQLKNGAGQLQDGAGQLKDGAEQLHNGAAQLAEGTAGLADGTSGLYNGTQALKDGCEVLSDGIGKLQDGTAQLKDGLIEFDEKAVQKLTSLLEEDLQELLDRLDATSEIAGNYTALTGNQDEDSSVRFIYKTEGVR